MIAMQYSIVLPADYDMAIIDRRIAEKGHLMNGFPGLGFKAYLSARKTAQASPGTDNVYAPFYLWQAQDGMNDFLCGPGFAALVQSFGRPVVHTWSVWHMAMSESLQEARFATKEVMPISPSSSLQDLRHAETGRAKEFAAQQPVLAVVAGFEPTTWSVVRFQLWRDKPDEKRLPQAVFYQVGHVSTATARS